MITVNEQVSTLAQAQSSTSSINHSFVVLLCPQSLSERLSFRALRDAMMLPFMIAGRVIFESISS
jgi:hypothetical protein